VFARELPRIRNDTVQIGAFGTPAERTLQFLRIRDKAGRITFAP
jgi:hypothetical protein